MEDTNANGKRDEGERSNFNTDDDICVGWRVVVHTKWDYGGANGRHGQLDATAVFEPDPNPLWSEYFMATSGSATWSETGNSGSDCSLEGGGTYSLFLPDEAEEDAEFRSSYLRIWDGGDPGLLRYSTVGHYSVQRQQDLYSVMTCDGIPPYHEKTDAYAWLNIDSDGPPPEIGYEGYESRTFAPDATSFGGTYTYVDDGIPHTTFTWTFTRLGK